MGKYGMRNLLLLVVIVLLVGACGRAKSTATAKPKLLEFEMITIPDVIGDPAERALYLAEHYWDKFDFANTLWVRQSVDTVQTDTIPQNPQGKPTTQPQVLEQVYVNYIDMLARIPLASGQQCMTKFLQKASVNDSMFAFVTELCDRYLYDPNSPMRHEELYIPVLEYVVYTSKIDTLEKLRPAHQLEMALKNRQGTQAADIRYTTASGARGSLYGIKTPYTLLFLYNPDCPNCAEVRARMIESPFLNQAVANNELKVLALYPDADLALWKAYVSNIPVTWINAYDEGTTITNSKSYDLRAIPSLYLLDAKKQVLLKDADFGQVENYLQQLPM